jgi:hypothetical protein
MEIILKQVLKWDGKAWTAVLISFYLSVLGLPRYVPGLSRDQRKGFSLL